VASSVQTRRVREKVPGSFSVTVYVVNVVMFEKAWVLDIADGEGRVASSSSVKVEELRPPVVEKVKSSGLSGRASLTTVIWPGKTTASAASDRSCFPVPQRPELFTPHVNATSAVWYGDPGMLTAELARPQSARVEMWPPQARTADVSIAVNVIVIEVALESA